MFGKNYWVDKSWNFLSCLFRSDLLQAIWNIFFPQLSFNSRNKLTCKQRHQRGAFTVGVWCVMQLFVPLTESYICWYISADWANEDVSLRNRYNSLTWVPGSHENSMATWDSLVFAKGSNTPTFLMSIKWLFHHQSDMLCQNALSPIWLYWLAEPMVYL